MDFFSPHHLERFANALLQFPLTLARFAHKILWATIGILWATIDILLDTIDILFLRLATMTEETSITISPSGFRIRAGSSDIWKLLTVCLFATVAALFALTRTGEGYNGIANIAEKIPPIIAAILQGPSTPAAAGFLAFPIAAACLLVTTNTRTILLISGMSIAMLAIVSHQTAPMESQIPPIPIANSDAGYQELLQSAAGVPAFAIAAILVLRTTATSTRVLIVGMLLALQLYISFHHGAPILEKIEPIVEKMPPLLEKIGPILAALCERISGPVVAALIFPVTLTLLMVIRATPGNVFTFGIFLTPQLYIAFHYAASIMKEIGPIMEKMPPLVEKIGPISTILYQDLGSVTAALTFPVTTTVIVVTRASSTRFIISGMFLAVYYNEALRTLEILKALPEVLKALLEALKPLIEVLVQHNAILQLLVFLAVMAFIRHCFSGGMPVFGIL